MMGRLLWVQFPGIAPGREGAILALFRWSRLTAQCCGCSADAVCECVGAPGVVDVQGTKTNP